MGQVLDYDYGKTEIKRSVYTPKGHVDADSELSDIRFGINEVLQGKRRIPVDLGLQPSPDRDSQQAPTCTPLLSGGEPAHPDREH
jgi:hypothetical protein